MDASDLRARAALLLTRIGWSHHQDSVLQTQTSEPIGRLLSMLDDLLKLSLDAGVLEKMHAKTDELYDVLEELEAELRRQERRAS